MPPEAAPAAGARRARTGGAAGDPHDETGDAPAPPPGAPGGGGATRCRTGTSRRGRCRWRRGRRAGPGRAAGARQQSARVGTVPPLGRRGRGPRRRRPRRTGRAGPGRRPGAELAAHIGLAPPHRERQRRHDEAATPPMRRTSQATAGASDVEVDLGGERPDRQVDLAGEVRVEVLLQGQQPHEVGPPRAGAEQLGHHQGDEDGDHREVGRQDAPGPPAREVDDRRSQRRPGAPAARLPRLPPRGTRPARRTRRRRGAPCPPTTRAARRRPSCRRGG